MGRGDRLREGQSYGWNWRRWSWRDVGGRTGRDGMGTSRGRGGWSSGRHVVRGGKTGDVDREEPRWIG